MLGHFLIKWKDLFLIFIKWMLISLVVGVVMGSIASVFAYGMEFVTELRSEYIWLIFGLPLGGLLIVFMYRKSGQGNNTGTNRIMGIIRSEETDMPGRVAPLILISTLITHLFGGSSGREGAALQFSASLADWFSRKFKMNESDRKILIMACMSGAFSALFGTPIAAAIFPMEVVSVGIMYYGALVPCVMSSLMAKFVAVRLGMQDMLLPYEITDTPYFFTMDAAKIIVLAIICAVVASWFCICLHRTQHTLAYYFKNPYLRIVVVAGVIIALRFALGTDAYIGTGEQTIRMSFLIAQPIWAFALKMLFTVLTLSSGFKGGEIVPSLFIGATLGSALSGIFGLPVDLAAACGMISLFCGVTNSPLSSMLMAMELFGSDGMLYFCIAIAVSYLLSGYQSLYIDQRIVYSKTENKYINSKSE